jgi:hypothetical protein
MRIVEPVAEGDDIPDDDPRLPFAFSASAGFYIQRRDLDQWRAVARSFRGSK